MRFCLAALVLVPVALARAGGETADALAQDMLKTLKEIKTRLATVKDQKTAEAARPQMLDLGNRLAKLMNREMILEKDPEQKKRLAELKKNYQKEGKAVLEDISREMKRIKELPGALKVLRDVPLLEIFEGDNARRARAKVDVQTLTVAVNTYYIQNGVRPKTLKQLTEKQPDGGRPFLEARALIDPWGRPYVYEPDMVHPQTGLPLIYSQGPRPGDPAGRIHNWPAPQKK
jgi:hypothetical protein